MLPDQRKGKDRAVVSPKDRTGSVSRAFYKVLSFIESVNQNKSRDRILDWSKNSASRLCITEKSPTIVGDFSVMGTAGFMGNRPLF